MIAVLPVMAPYALEEAIGYDGNARYIGMFWTPEMQMEGAVGGLAVRLSDGRHEWLGNIAGWATFVSHPLVQPYLEKYAFIYTGGAPLQVLVLDRDTRSLVLFSFGEGLAFLARQNAPVLGAVQDERRHPHERQDVADVGVTEHPLERCYRRGTAAQPEVACPRAHSRTSQPCRTTPAAWPRTRWRAILASSAWIAFFCSSVNGAFGMTVFESPQPIRPTATTAATSFQSMSCFCASGSTSVE